MDRVSEATGNSGWKPRSALALKLSLTYVVSRGRAAYDADVQLQFAGEAIQHRIGEVVSRLSETIIAAHPDIRFRPIKLARNLIAHNYAIVDPQIVWTTLAVELHRDAAKIRDPATSTAATG